MGLFSVGVVDKSALSSVVLLDDDESVLSVEKSDDGDESLLSSVDPLSDVSLLSVESLSDEPSLLSSVDPLSDVSLLSVESLSDEPSLLSSVVVVLAPLAYMIAEAGKTIEIIIKKINKIFTRFIFAIAMILHIKPL